MNYDEIASRLTAKQMAEFETSTGLTIAEFVWSKEHFDEIAGLDGTAVLDSKRLTADDIDEIVLNKDLKSIKYDDEIVVNKDLKSIRYDQLTLF